jgi:hypothetical protein
MFLQLPRRPAVAQCGQLLKCCRIARAVKRLHTDVPLLQGGGREALCCRTSSEAAGSDAWVVGLAQ